eukprot:COSAG01_NODE_425_length_17240_cov_29.899306_3_plen_75_part_00
MRLAAADGGGYGFYAVTALHGWRLLPSCQPAGWPCSAPCTRVAMSLKNRMSFWSCLFGRSRNDMTVGRFRDIVL